MAALCQEIDERKDYFENKQLGTVYFGGGTPSLLSSQQLELIFKTIKKNFIIAPDAEITLEANPDDISVVFLQDLQTLGFNRLSIGIQSFDDDDLRVINRRHNAQQAFNAVKLAQAQGFDNISIDLIFALPNQTLEKWKKNLDIAFSLNIQHISSYNLIYEEGTVFYQKLQQGIFKETDDETSLEMYKMLIQEAEKNGFLHYETSNFALKGLHSIHNSNYWSGAPYLGIGAGAHSFNGKSRRWNISDNTAYIKGIEEGQALFELENIDQYTAYNEFVMTGLRTMWGCDLTKLEKRFGKDLLQYCMQCALSFLSNHQLLIEDNILTINKDSLFISDQIMSELMWIE